MPRSGFNAALTQAAAIRVTAFREVPKMRALCALLSLCLLPALGGCTVVSASADVVGAAGHLAAATANTTAGVMRTAAKAGSGDKSGKNADKCAGDSNSEDCKN
jgi:hypothetical protein